VVSVGNITVGGTGKTPVTAHIARLLLERGLRVAVLTRGYGGTMEGTIAIVSDGSKILLTAEECGDEPFLLASTIPGLMVVMGADRHGAGLLAMERLSPDVFLLDDGFQHIRLYRDMNILLLDADNPFGNGWTLPAGLLREPRAAALRADWIIHTRCDDFILTIPMLDLIPQASASYRLSGLTPLSGGTAVPVASLGMLTAFAGIAEPERFFTDLRKLSPNVVQTLALPDHAAYGPATIGAITGLLRDSGAGYAVTTGKDAVKLKQIPPELASRILVANLALRLDGAAPLMSDLFNLLQK
jgi:tetraacyldisaccharide 4'-kinase